MEQEKLYSIYRLFDKRNSGITRYVGFTTNLALRLSQHMTGEKLNQRKDAWTRSLGTELGIEVIEEGWTTLSDVKAQEAYWIGCYLLEGAPLLNLSIPESAKQICAENYEEYSYYQTEVPLDSELYRTLMKDAKNTGMSKQISRLIVTRLSDYYAGIPSAVPVAVEVPEVKQPPANAKSNALASMDEW